MELGKPILMRDVEDHLEHYGVKGMQWGKRRTREVLAKASAKREASMSPAQRADKEVKLQRQKVANSRRIISDSDLNQIIDRLSREKKLRDMVTADQAPGKKVAKDLAAKYSNRTARNLAIGAAAVTSGAIGAKLESKFNLSQKLNLKPGAFVDAIKKASK